MRLFRRTAAIAALWLLGCDSASGGLSSGVAKDKHLAQLSSAELEQICDAANRYRSAALPAPLLERALCTQQGLQSHDAQLCESARTACLDALQAHDADSDAARSLVAAVSAQRFTCYAEAELAACDASVAELESCIGSTFSGSARALNSISCSSLAAVAIPDAGDDADAPARSGIGGSRASAGSTGSAAGSGASSASSGSAAPTACEALNTKCPGLGNVNGRVRNPSGSISLPRDAGTDAAKPPVTSVSCEQLDLQFDGSRCALSACSAVQCACQPQARSFTLCNSVRGCLSALDCEMACAATSSSIVTSCGATTSCVTDADCGDYHCVMSSAGASSGSCTRGEGGDACDQPTDCQSGMCTSLSGTLGTCTGNAATGTSCNLDRDCRSGICYQPSGFGAGQCSDGALADPCSSDSDCSSHICVYTVSGGTSTCGDGAIGSACQSDSDCTNQRCAFGGRATGTCVAGAPGDPCDDASDCSNGTCNTSPTSFLDSCGYAPGDTCDGGIADCNGECRPVQAVCAGSSCTPSCGASACSSVTLGTWNPADKDANVTLSNSDRTATTASNVAGVRATLGKTSGSWYWEVTLQSVGSGAYPIQIGVTNASAPLDESFGDSFVPGAGLGSDGTLSESYSGESELCPFTTSDVIGVALDADMDVVFFSINGVWQGGGDPTGRVNGIPIDLGLAAAFPIVSLSGNAVAVANFGAQAFAHTPPSGFSALYQ